MTESADMHNEALTHNVPILRLTREEQSVSPDDIWREALGLAVASAVVRQSRCLQAADGQLLHAGLHLVISTNHQGPVLSTLAQLVHPLKTAQLRIDGLSEIDREIRQEQIDQLKTQYRSYVRNDTLPDPRQVVCFGEFLTHLENAQRSARLLECPLPGRLVLAIEKNPSLLATYDDFSFSCLLDAAGKPRGILDLELLGKSWRQQIFDGGQLEGVCIKVVGDPKAWAIVLARPETTARFLLASEPGVAGFADCCWFVDARQALDLKVGIADAAAWQRILSSLMERCAGPASDPVRLSHEAGKQEAALQEEIATICSQKSPDQRFFEQLPKLASKLGFVLGMIESQDRLTSVTEAQFAKGLAYVKLNTRHRQAILRIARQESSEQQFQQQCEIVLQKISALGPISARDLARTFDDQRLQWLLPILKHLTTTEQIMKRPDGRFDIPQRWLRNLTMEIC